MLIILLLNLLIWFIISLYIYKIEMSSTITEFIDLFFLFVIMPIAWLTFSIVFWIIELLETIFAQKYKIIDFLNKDLTSKK